MAEQKTAAKIDLNSCTIRHLTRLGLNHSISQSIVNYRRKHKLFQDFDELWLVTGMNRHIFRFLKSNTFVSRDVILGFKTGRPRSAKRSKSQVKHRAPHKTQKKGQRGNSAKKNLKIANLKTEIPKKRSESSLDDKDTEHQQTPETKNKERFLEVCATGLRARTPDLKHDSQKNPVKINQRKAKSAVERTNLKQSQVHGNQINLLYTYDRHSPPVLNVTITTSPVLSPREAFTSPRPLGKVQGTSLHPTDTNPEFRMPSSAFVHFPSENNDIESIDEWETAASKPILKPVVLDQDLLNTFGGKIDASAQTTGTTHLQNSSRNMAMNTETEPLTIRGSGLTYGVKNVLSKSNLEQLNQRSRDTQKRDDIESWLNSVPQDDGSKHDGQMSKKQSSSSHKKDTKRVRQRSPDQPTREHETEFLRKYARKESREKIAKSKTKKEERPSTSKSAVVHKTKYCIRCELPLTYTSEDVCPSCEAVFYRDKLRSACQKTHGMMTRSRSSKNRTPSPCSCDRAAKKQAKDALEIHGVGIRDSISEQNARKRVKSAPVSRNPVYKLDEKNPQDDQRSPEKHEITDKTTRDVDNTQNKHRRHKHGHRPHHHHSNRRHSDHKCSCGKTSHRHHHKHASKEKQQNNKNNNGGCIVM